MPWIRNAIASVARKATGESPVPWSAMTRGGPLVPVEVEILYMLRPLGEGDTCSGSTRSSWEDPFNVDWVLHAS